MLFFVLSLLFLFVTEKDGKTCLNGEKDDFDQQTACEAPIHWSKSTTRKDIENYKRETETTLILRNGDRKRPKSCPLSLPFQVDPRAEIHQVSNSDDLGILWSLKEST